jgi:hypothetical protein
LAGGYDHEIYGCASQNGVQETRNTRKSRRASLGPDENNREYKDVCNGTTSGRVGYIRAPVVESQWEMKGEGLPKASAIETIMNESYFLASARQIVNGSRSIGGNGTAGSQ